MGYHAVAYLAVAVMAAAASTLLWVVVVVFHLSVGVAVVIVAGGPMEGDMVIWVGLFHGRQCGQWCVRWGIPSIDGGGLGGGTPIVVCIGCGCVLVIVGEGPAFVGVDSDSGRLSANSGGLVSLCIFRGIRRRRPLSFLGFQLDTRYGRGRGSWST